MSNRSTLAVTGNSLAQPSYLAPIHHQRARNPQPHPPRLRRRSGRRVIHVTKPTPTPAAATGEAPHSDRPSLHTGLERLDKNKDGTVDRDELIHLLRVYKLQIDDPDRLIDECETSRGRVSWRPFLDRLAARLTVSSRNRPALISIGKTLTPRQPSTGHDLRRSLATTVVRPGRIPAQQLTARSAAQSVWWENRNRQAPSLRELAASEPYRPNGIQNELLNLCRLCVSDGGLYLRDLLRHEDPSGSGYARHGVMRSILARTELAQHESLDLTFQLLRRHSTPMGLINYVNLLRELGQLTAKSLLQSLERMDLEHTGSVKEEHLHQVIDAYRIPLESTEKEKLIAQCGRTDGTVDYKLFLRRMGGCIQPESVDWYRLFDHPIPKTPKP